MAREGAQDRIYKFLLERGAQGASAAELAAAFLSAGSVQEPIARRVVDPLLSGDRRFARDEEGRWHAVPLASAPGQEVYTIAEFRFAPGTGGDGVPVECGVVRVERGRPGEARVTPINAGRSLAPGAQLPALSRSELSKAPALVRVLEHLCSYARGTTLASYERTPLHARACREPSERQARPGGLGRQGEEIPYLSTQQLARRMELIPRDATLPQCAEALGVPCPEAPGAGDLARASAEILVLLLGKLQEMGISGSASMEEFLKPPYIEVDFSRYDFDWGFLETLPEEPGVYVMRDANGIPIYVGKALNLRQRVTSYFRRTVCLDERIERIRERVFGLAIERVGSELEALLLEHRYIRDLAPELNIAAEVHERPGTYRRDKNILLILPSRAGGHVELLMVANGERLVRLRVPQTDPEAARAAIEETYFSRAALPPAEADAEQLELVWSWLDRNRDRVNSIDVDAAGGLENLMRLLADYLSDSDAPRVRTFRV
jgi:hypothetical protein